MTSPSFFILIVKTGLSLASPGPDLGTCSHVKLSLLTGGTAVCVTRLGCHFSFLFDKLFNAYLGLLRDMTLLLVKMHAINNIGGPYVHFFFLAVFSFSSRMLMLYFSHERRLSVFLSGWIDAQWVHTYLGLLYAFDDSMNWLLCLC